MLDPKCPHCGHALTAEQIRALAPDTSPDLSALSESTAESTAELEAVVDPEAAGDTDIGDLLSTTCGTAGCHHPEHQRDRARS